LVESGKGAMLHLADGREVIDGLAGLWNVNVGHGRGVLADAAAEQMRKIAYASAYVGATNEPAIRLAEKYRRPRLFEQFGGVLYGRAVPNRTSRRSRPRAITGRSRTNRTRPRSSRASTAITVSRWRR